MWHDLKRLLLGFWTKINSASVNKTSIAINLFSISFICTKVIIIIMIVSFIRITSKQESSPLTLSLELVLGAL